VNTGLGFTRHVGGADVASGLDTRDFTAIAKALREAKPLLAKEMKQGLKRAGEITAAEARVISSEHSTSIPPSIKTGVRGSVVEVRAGGVVGARKIARELHGGGYGTRHSDAHRKRLERAAEGSAIAGLYEYGNKGGTSVGGTFRHPVFGDRGNWVEQRRYPFLRPAVEKTKRQAEDAMVNVLDEVSRKLVS
jgi:hypothetical protein